MVAVVLILGAMAGAQSPAPSDPPSPAAAPPSSAAQRQLPISLARVRAGLERPPVLRLTVPDPPPDFRIEIQQRPFIQDLIERLDFSSGPMPRGGIYAYEQQQRMGTPEIAQPLVMVDALGIASSVRKAVSSARRSHAEAAAREEVQRALAEFCATHECP
jgi:hypothetical protein